MYLLCWLPFQMSTLFLSRDGMNHELNQNGKLPGELNWFILIPGKLGSVIMEFKGTLSP